MNESQRHGVGPRNPAPLRPIAKPIPPEGAAIESPGQNPHLVQIAMDRDSKRARVNLLQELIHEAISGNVGVWTLLYQGSLADYLAERLERENA